MSKYSFGRSIPDGKAFHRLLIFHELFWAQSIFFQILSALNAMVCDKEVAHPNHRDDTVGVPRNMSFSAPSALDAVTTPTPVRVVIDVVLRHLVG